MRSDRPQISSPARRNGAMGSPGSPLSSSMPLWRGSRPRKRWRYIGVFGEDIMLCAAHVKIGPLPHAFWSIWERGTSRSWGRTRFRPGGREVVIGDRDLAIERADVSVRLAMGECEAVESLCPSGSDGWGWTRKRAGFPVTGSVELGSRSYRVSAFGVDDFSLGYHTRETRWRWSAGVGSAEDGTPLAWNLVEGINDPARGSERAVWVGVPESARVLEPAPVRFRGDDAIDFADGSSLSFRSESERSRRDDLLLIRSDYTHRFGTFTGSIEGITLASGFGVMESHEARW